MKVKNDYTYIFIVSLVTGIIYRATMDFRTLYSFTSLSNFYIAFILSLWLWKNHKGEVNIKIEKYYFFGIILILITGMIYHFFVLPQKYVENPNYLFFTYGNIISHYLAPLGMVLHWIVVAKKLNVTLYEPLRTLVFPIVYFIGASLYGYLSSSFVYFFMDFNSIGALEVIAWCLKISGIFLIIGYTLYGINSMLKPTRNYIT